MKQAKVIRAELLKAVQRNGRSAIALSGGVDSCAVLAAFMTEGIKPIIVSYTPSTHESTDFQMARQTAANLGLEFVPAIVDMSADALERDVRHVIGLGFKSKVEVESLAPMVTISNAASAAGAKRIYTGDQSDGYFCLSKWAAHNYDRAQGVPFRERSRNVKEDTDPTRIDAIRKRYYELDLSCSGGVRAVCDSFGVNTAFPFRSMVIFKAFNGTVWTDVNTPRIKEPIRVAFADWFSEGDILVRPTQVNLHKGDSHFGDTLSKVMMEQFPGYATPRGLYSAIARGEV